MSSDKFLKAMGYIDDDLIAESDQRIMSTRENTRANAKVNPIKKKGNVIPLLSKIAVAALVLFIGGAVLRITFTGSKSDNISADREAISKTANEQQGVFYNGEVVGIPRDRINDVYSEGEWENYDSTEAPEDAMAEAAENVPETEAIAEDPADVDIIIVVEGLEYIYCQDIDPDARNITEQIGVVEESTDPKLVGCTLYGYEYPEDADKVLAAIKDGSIIMIFEEEE